MAEKTARARVHRRIGTMKCIGCETVIPVKITDHGTLSMPCTWCDSRNTAPKGTAYFDSMMKRVTLDKPLEDAPPPAPVAKKEDKPEPKKPATPFDVLMGKA